ncbi:MAG: GGDEF domain-containing protein, partial [Eubacterium sp.]|nr:GGDEF domain-containing protein [Eubacterium sp.]
SVKRPETELGRRAYEKLKAYIKDGKAGDEEALKIIPIFTESCGCIDHLAEDERSFRSEAVRDKLHVTSYSEIIKSSSADFTGVPTFEQLLVEIKRYIKIINPEEFYLCMCVVAEPLSVDGISDIEEKERTTDLTGYSSQICIPAAYRKGEYCRYGRFDVHKLLPEEVTEGNKGKFYTVIPVHYQDRCYGYCVLGNSRLMIDSELFHLFIMNINNAIENIRKQNMLNSMVQKLNRMWIYDTLTGIFNRAGFFKFANSVIDEAVRKGNKLFVLFLDLDGLKDINDKYGHDEGDAFIKAMGNVLSQVRGHGELLMRYGGDEFVVMAQGYTDEDAGKYIERIQDGIDKYNASSNKPYKLEASMGYNIVGPDEIHNLEELIESADKEMYKVKKQKKRGRAADYKDNKREIKE